MATDTSGMSRINHEKLIRFVSRSFAKLGVPADQVCVISTGVSPIASCPR